MKRDSEGIVIEVQNNNVAKVKMARHGDCVNCGSCAGDGSIIAECSNVIGATIGQRVKVEVTDVSMIRSAFVMFILPLFCTVLGAYFGILLSNLFNIFQRIIQVIFASIGFFLSILFIKYYDKIQKEKSKMPKIFEIIN